MHEFLFFLFFDNKGIKPFSFTRFSAMEGILGLSLILDDKFQFSARVSLQKDLKPILVLTQQFHNFAACTEPQIKLTRFVLDSSFRSCKSIYTFDISESSNSSDRSELVTLILTISVRPSCLIASTLTSTLPLGVDLMK